MGQCEKRRKERRGTRRDGDGMKKGREGKGMTGIQCESKKSPCGFLTFFPNGWDFFNPFLNTYYTFISTLDYKFLFNYLQL